MIEVTMMSTDLKLEEIANKYLHEGYDVKIHPSADELPSFLADTEVLLLAKRDQEYRALHPPGNVAADFRMSLAREPEARDLEQMLDRAADVNLQGYPDAALLLGLAATEAIIRQTVRQFNRAVDRASPRAMIDMAVEHRAVTEEERFTLQTCWNLRNTVAHGFRPVEIPETLILQLIEIGEKLTARHSGRERLFSRKGLVHTDFNEAGGKNLKPLFDATKLLEEILQTSSSPVQAEWDSAIDANGFPIVILRLRDPFGAVTGTFEPGEFDDEPDAREMLRVRFRRLWGDLLQIRSHKQLKQLELELSSQQQGE